MRGAAIAQADGAAVLPAVEPLVTSTKTNDIARGRPQGLSLQKAYDRVTRQGYER